MKKLFLAMAIIYLNLYIIPSNLSASSPSPTRPSNIGSSQNLWQPRSFFASKDSATKIEHKPCLRCGKREREFDLSVSDFCSCSCKWLYEQFGPLDSTNRTALEQHGAFQVVVFGGKNTKLTEEKPK